MKNISLKLDEKIFSEVEEIATLMEKPRNRYINEALNYYNAIIRRKLLKEQLRKESMLCRKESMKIMKEFDQLDNAD